MITVLPEWYTKADEKIKRAIMDIAASLHLDFRFVLDSKIISESRSHIMMALVRIYEQVNVENRERLDDFAKSCKKTKKKKKVVNRKSKKGLGRNY